MIKSTDDALSVELLEVQRTLGWMDVVMGSISDAVYVTNDELKLIFVNQAFANLLETPRVFLLGKRIEDVFKIRVKKNPQKEFLSAESLLEKNGDSGLNVFDWHGPNSQKIFKISHQFIPTIHQTVSIAKDITTEYEQSVIKSNFINIASHQLRTPMTAIMTYAHILHDGYAGSIEKDQEKLAKTIIDSSERMITLINDILLITRIQNGEADLKEKDTTLGVVLDNLEFELIPKIKAKKINFSTNFTPKAKLYACNKFITYEILSNLLTNATQYTPDGGKIVVTAKVEINSVNVSVKDDGIGIPADYVPKIFDQFSRANNAFEVFNEGTGLGLFVVKMLLDQVDGKICCTSQLGEGSTFKVSLPV